MVVSFIKIPVGHKTYVRKLSEIAKYAENINLATY